MARSTSPNLAVPDTPVADSETVTGSSGPRSVVSSLFVSLRPGAVDQESAGLRGSDLFEQGRCSTCAAVLTAIAAFVIFCVLSGVVYLLNDVMDRESDRRHPLKSRRPIAAGALSVAHGPRRGGRPGAARRSRRHSRSAGGSASWRSPTSRSRGCTPAR